MRVAFYVAIAENGVIGRDGGLPWRLSSDLKRFKAQTMGKPILMGRKTWDSLPTKPLPGRLNIVVTRDRSFAAEGAEVVQSVEEGVKRAEQLTDSDELAVIGGGEIFRSMFSLADRLYVTHVLADIGGDTFFPPIEPAEWKVVESTDYPVGERDTHPTRHVVYERVHA